jgi:hypothetical protein
MVSKIWVLRCNIHCVFKGLSLSRDEILWVASNDEVTKNSAFGLLSYFNAAPRMKTKPMLRCNNTNSCLESSKSPSILESVRKWFNKLLLLILFLLVFQLANVDVSFW